MKITVFGASGGIGREVVKQLLNAGHDVTAVVRETANVIDAHPRLDVAILGSMDAPEALVPALSNSGAVISAVGPRRLGDGPVASRVTRSILRAMLETSARRLVAVSASPVGEPAKGDGVLMRRIARPLIKALLSDLYLDLARMEGEIELSGTQWTVVRPPRLSRGPVTARYRTVVGGNVPNGYLISRADVAHAMCSALGNPQTIGQPVGVAN